MASVAVPTFARMGFFSRNEMQSTARELYALLRAAKIYAATYRVDTAVVYSDLDPDPDVSHQTPLECLQAAAMMYEHPAFKLPDDEPVFVPVQDTEGVFDEFQGFTGVILRDPIPRPGPVPDDAAEKAAEKAGLSQVAVYFPRSDSHEDYMSVFRSQTVPEERWLQAHVFTPSGRMRNTSPERFQVYIGLKEGEDEEERWVDPEDHSLGERYKTIELHRATGRVRIAAD